MSEWVEGQFSTKSQSFADMSSQPDWKLNVSCQRDEGVLTSLFALFADVCAAIYSSMKTQQGGGPICHTFTADIALADF